MVPRGKTPNCLDRSSQSFWGRYSLSSMLLDFCLSLPFRILLLLLAALSLLSGCLMVQPQLSQQQKLACAVFPLVGLTAEGESLLLNQPLPTYPSLLKEQVVPTLSIQNLSNQTYFTTGVSASCRF